MISGALYIASSLVIFAGAGPVLWGYPALGVIGYALAGVLTVSLIERILRSKRSWKKKAWRVGRLPISLMQELRVYGRLRTSALPELIHRKCGGWVSRQEES
jgi:hypothetical protein